MLTRTRPICWTTVCRWLPPLGGRVTPGDWAAAAPARPRAAVTARAAVRRRGKRVMNSLLGFGGAWLRQLRRRALKVRARGPPWAGGARFRQPDARGEVYDEAA